MSKYSEEEIEKICNNTSVLDYFLYLEKTGKVARDRNSGKDTYFRTESNKFSVTEDRFYDFKTGEGGKIIKAVMTLENKSWKDSLDFLAEFSNIDLENIIAERKNIVKQRENNKPFSVNIQYSGIPNNGKLLDYFKERGISNKTLQENTRQIHYEYKGKKFFGIGLENLSGGFEIRNSISKMKVGKNDISVKKGTQNELVLFEGMTDLLSFLELQKLNEKENKKTLISLNSVTNVDKFLEKYKDFDGKIFLCLDGDKAGNEATNKIQFEFRNKNLKDIRPFYSININNNKDLNDYLKNKLNLIEKNLNFSNEKLSKDERINTRPEELSNSQQDEQGNVKQDYQKFSNPSKSEQKHDNTTRRNFSSTNVGNGPEYGGENGLGTTGGGKSIREPQQNDVGENGIRGNDLGGLLNIEVDEIVKSYQNQKINNEQIKILVDKICSVSENGKININDNFKISEGLKDILNQYKSGGVDKKGRGILDEYYTNTEIVDTILNLIKDEFKNKKSISVLEPSVGTGNFLNIPKELNLQTLTTAFEINETTAKIAKIFHPNTDINLRSFESEFIKENGEKKEYDKNYDLVIGNPPYGEHRGYYKGLGEEQKITKYEDYFVKRSLDTMKEGGILAMVLPSSWLNRQKKLSNAELTNAFRLPSGVFSGTQVGTDIIILKKNSLLQNKDISNYFNDNTEKILGEIKEKSNRFGRTEFYVDGNLEDALHKIENIQKKASLIDEAQMSLFDTVDNSVNTSLEHNEKDERFVEETGRLVFNRLKTEQENIDKEEKEQTKKIIKEVLNQLELTKFKTSALKSTIEKYKKYEKEIDSLTQKDIDYIKTSSKKILEKNEVENNEYVLQSKPNIKKGILKYQFSKEDEIVPASKQNSIEITQKDVDAFRDTNYNGVINNHEKHKDFANFYKGDWIHNFYYAEGNIYSKLEQLEKDFPNKEGENKIQYEKQKERLESVLPKPKKLEEIIISPNHEFVHSFDLGYVEKEFFNYRTREYEKQQVQHNLAQKFIDFLYTLPHSSFAGSSAWEVSGYVNNESVTGSDKERNALVRERRKIAGNDLFKKFIKEELTDAERKDFVEKFNKNYNNIHVPDYSKFPLFSNIYKNFKGKPLELSIVQKAGIGRQTTKGVGLLAHEVGFGKTLSGILSMHEAMERGNAKKPLIVVPNDSILNQWVDTIFETIPNAKVNVLGNLGKNFDLSHFNNKDGEITLVTYEGFNNIGFSNDITKRLAEKFNYISASELKGITNSERDIQIDIEKGKEVEGKMKRGKVYDWEDFGFDHLTFDEVHNANHIVGKVKIENRTFASDFRNQNQQTSKLGINTWMASQYIQDKNDGRNITLLSATPFTNKPLEYYSILSLIANKRLEESGYFRVNNFFDTFMEADSDMEIDAKGDVKFKMNVRRFKNNTLFQQLLSEFIDIKGEEDNPELKRPIKLNKEYKVEQNDLTKEQYSNLNENFLESEKGSILKHILNARLIAISPYLSPYYEGQNPSIKEFVENSPKLKHTMDLIIQNKKDIPNAGQIIYSELAVSEFPKLKDYLVQEVGYKSEEVGLITGATSKANRLKIQDDFNNGKIKIVIGSEAIQEGMNLQKKATDTYFLSLPYNFTSLRQIEGRTWRQGNENDYVRMNFMLTNDSIDVFMLQKLQAKQARYLEAMKKGADILDISDINTQELKTSIITDPRTRADIEIEVLKKKIENDKNRFIADNSFILRKCGDLIKAKDNVADKERLYNSYIESRDKSDNESLSNFWNDKIEFAEKYLKIAKAAYKEEFNKLREKGNVDINNIQEQIEFTEKEIERLDEKLENLPEEREKLIEKYTIEKEESLKREQQIDYKLDRSNENLKLFNVSVNNIKENGIEREKEEEERKDQEEEEINYRRRGR